MEDILTNLHPFSRTDSKYYAIYKNIIHRALARATSRDEAQHICGYIEAHHIVPRSFRCKVPNNIIDSTSNIAYLTAREHFIAHLCLCLFITQKQLKQKVCYAMQRMRCTNPVQFRSNTSRRYQFERIDAKEITRLYNGCEVRYVSDADEIIKLKAQGWSDQMPDAYKKGRVGMMLGRTHNQQTRLQQRISAKKAKTGSSEITIEDEIRYKKRNKIEFTQEEQEWLSARAVKVSLQRSQLCKSRNGAHSIETKQRMSTSIRKAYETPSEVALAAWQKKIGTKQSPELIAKRMLRMREEKAKRIADGTYKPRTWTEEQKRRASEARLLKHRSKVNDACVQVTDNLSREGQ